MREAQAKLGNARILYDADAAAYVQTDWFDPEALCAGGQLEGSAAGRGQVHIFRYGGTQHVLRHYRRGGSAAKWLVDRYLWTGLDRTRAWREWRLLARLVELGLPAPRPFAARIMKSGLFYRADLITVRLADASSLAQRLKSGALPESTWRDIGSVIAKFHAAGLCHADLNAHNVLVDARGAVALIDFDRAQFRRFRTGWPRRNLARLLRSLRKLQRLDPALHFGEPDFEVLLQGYRGRKARG